MTVKAGLYRRTDIADIQVDLTATPLQDGSTDSFWKISQERSYTLKMNIPESAPEKERSQKDQTLYWEEEEGFNLDQNESEDVSNPEEQEKPETEDEKNATQKGGDEENSRGADGMTVVLSAGIVATIVYMIKVI